MKGGAPGGRLQNLVAGVVLFAVLAGVALLLDDYLNPEVLRITGDKITNQVRGEIFGMMPDPVQPQLIDPVVESFTREKSKKVVIKRIPRISKGMMMPHPYWGECSKCHLFRGGPKAGEQWKSPVGSALEMVSTIMKVGPPIRPDSTRPHPPAGRCIKCHDIVVDAPI